MDITRSNGKSGAGKQWRMVTATTDLSPAQMKAAACKMIRTLVQLMRTLNRVPEQRTIVMQLYYRGGITPIDYEPPLFRSCTYEDLKFWARKPLVMKVGNVNSNHCEVSLKVRSILGPCEDDDDICVKSENIMIADFSTSSTAEATEVYTSGGHDKSHSGLRRSENQNLLLVQKDIQSIGCFVAADIKKWAIQKPNSTFDYIDILAQFPQISKEHDLHGKYFPDAEDCTPAEVGQLPTSPPTVSFPISWDIAGADEEETRLWDKVLFHINRSKCITVGKLTKNLDKCGETLNTAMVIQLIEKMTKNGYVKIISNSSSRKFGHRVLHSTEESEEHLQEIVEAVKEFVITDCKADIHDSSEEDSLSEDTKVELRMKSKLDKFGDSPVCYLREYHKECTDNTNLYAKDLQNTAQVGDILKGKEVKAGLPLVDSQGSNPKEMNMDREKPENQGRVRKASKVEEPIYQHVYAKRKRL
ncbi:hypothetical protein R1flu_023893 [Riccia fluitans]|uniref:HORMA domain-containing protein n=1 Tax=Riccia fluitans TaxID=41844 RepID=A0ABD1XTC8_9MARC